MGRVTHFDKALEHVFNIEGLFSDDATDRGGKTKYGITEAVARKHGYQGEMRDLSPMRARAIYKLAYWDGLRLDDVAALSQPIALEIFDTGVNCGQGVAAKFLQRSLNALNREAADYPDVVVDSELGPVTVSTLRTYLQRRGRDGEIVMLRALNALQGARYIAIAESDSSQEKYVYGWFRQRVN